MTPAASSWAEEGEEGLVRARYNYVCPNGLLPLKWQKKKRFGTSKNRRTNEHSSVGNNDTLPSCQIWPPASKQRFIVKEALTASQCSPRLNALMAARSAVDHDSSPFFHLLDPATFR